MKRFALPVLLLAAACSTESVEPTAQAGVVIVNQSMQLNEITDELSVHEANISVYNPGEAATVVLRVSLDCDGTTLNDSIIFNIAQGDTVVNDFIFGECNGNVANPKLTAVIGQKGK